MQADTGISSTPHRLRSHLRPYQSLVMAPLSHAKSANQCPQQATGWLRFRAQAWRQSNITEAPQSFEMCGSVIPGGVANATVRTTTNNVAELVAFTRGLTWAAYHPLAQQQPGIAHPVCMRYDSIYAAMIATGIWRAKKHKEMAAAARHAWATLMKRTRGRLWLKHVKGHSGHTWNDVADRLADQGRRGEQRYTPVDY